MGRMKELWIDRQNELADWECEYDHYEIEHARSVEQDQNQEGPLIVRSTMRIYAEAYILPKNPCVQNDGRQTKAPPLSGEYIIRLILPMRDREAIIGDLIENYAVALSRHGVRKARIIFWIDVTSLVLPSLAKRIRSLAVCAFFLRLVGWILGRSA